MATQGGVGRVRGWRASGGGSRAGLRFANPASGPRTTDHVSLERWGGELGREGSLHPGRDADRAGAGWPAGRGGPAGRREGQARPVSE